MKQSIAGVAPPQLSEVTVMTVWPTLASFGLGRWLGRLYGIRAGAGPFTLGKLFVLLTIPLALALFAWSLMPWATRRYVLTNRRVAVQEGLSGHIDLFVDLDRFDTVDVQVQPGQAWYPAGDLIFRKGNVETFRLEGVSRPETFRQTVLKAGHSFSGVKKESQRQLQSGTSV